MSLQGTIRVPSDKSISHRAVLFASLAKGRSHLSDVLPSADVLATIDAMRALGARIDQVDTASGLRCVIDGIDLSPRCDGTVSLYCGNSGTTTRLLMGVLSGLGVNAVLTGDASLSARPMRRVMDPLETLGASFESNDGCLPVRVLDSAPLHAAAVTIPQASAQVKSAVLLAGMQASGMTSVTEPAHSRNHTELLLPAFGVDVEVDGLTSRVQGPVRLHAHDMRVPADPSSAAFVAVAASLVPGSDVTMTDVALNPTRIGALEVLCRMGASIDYEDVRHEGSEPVGNVRVRHGAQLTATRVTPDEIPTLIDEIPVLALAAALASGETVFESCGELRVKESDRMQAIIEGLAAFGVRAFNQGDDLHVVGRGGALSSVPSHVELTTHGDHRLAMTWYLAGPVFGSEVVLDDRDCVVVSWPDFFTDIESLMR